MIDLDHNAGTALDARVGRAMAELLVREDLGNPSSLHRRGQAARAVVERARRRVAAAVGAEPLEVTFTSGGTEADALAVLGSGRALRRAGQPCGVLTSPLEHPAVLGAARQLEREGHALAMVQPDVAGRITSDAVRAALDVLPEVGLVSLAAANHELGNAYDIAGLAAAVREAAPAAVLHTDAVQALGRVPVNRAAWHVDLLSISAHKIGGPRGIGALVHAKSVAVDPLFGAGHHERGRRPGTEAVLLIHGFGLAAELAEAERQATSAHTRKLRQRLIDGLTALGGRIHGDPVEHVGNTVTTAFPGADGHLLMIALDLDGIAVSTGAACDAGSAQPSAVLLALGHTDDAAASVRVSLSPRSTVADVDGLLEALPRLLARQRAAQQRGAMAS